MSPSTFLSDSADGGASYIPIKVDYTDLFDVMAFFSGDLDGRNGHEELAKGIAEQGKEYATKHWRYEDMEACTSLPSSLASRADFETDFFRLALEWARCTCTSCIVGEGSADSPLSF